MVNFICFIFQEHTRVRIVETDLSRGLSWLNGSQNVDGGWGFKRGEPSDFFATSLLDWSRFVKANLHKKLKAYHLAVELFISYQNSDGGWTRRPNEKSSVQMTAYVLPILVPSGSSISSAVIRKGVVFLERSVMPDRGWGEPWDYELRGYDGVYVKPGNSQPWITALVITALLETKKSKTRLIRNGIEYLIKTRLADGGWGISKDSEKSETDCTSFALSAFVKTNSDPKIMEQATKLLLGLQNNDGGWGWPNVEKKEPSSVESTERKMHALLDTNLPITSAALNRAKKFLLSVQNIDGSWGLYLGKDGVTYVTAGVLAALSRMRSKT